MSDGAQLLKDKKNIYRDERRESRACVHADGLLLIQQ